MLIGGVGLVEGAGDAVVSGVVIGAGDCAQIQTGAVKNRMQANNDLFMVCRRLKVKQPFVKNISYMTLTSQGTE